MDERTTITVACPKPPLPIVWVAAGFRAGLAAGVLIVADGVHGIKRDAVKAGVLCVDAACHRVQSEKIGPRP